jgi:hypothetical protein
VLSIIVLVHDETLNGRLGIIAAFNILISEYLSCFTEAKRTDVFAVTAAYSIYVGILEACANDYQLFCIASRIRGAST